MVKVILATNGIKIDSLEGLAFDRGTSTLMFRYGNKKYRTVVEDSAGTYIKVFEDGGMEMITKVAQCTCVEKRPAQP